MKQPNHLLNLMVGIGLMLRRSKPANDYQRGFHDALTLIHGDVKALYRRQPVTPWAERELPSC